jgi:hypothetical protein
MGGDSENSLYVAALLALGVASAFWFGLRGLIARASGWDSLASWFRVLELPAGERFRFASGSMGKGVTPVRYNRCLVVVVSDAGLGISILSVFGRSPSLFIPWDKVESAKSSRVMFTNATVIRVRGQWPAITLYGSPAVAAAAAYGRSLSKRTP